MLITAAMDALADQLSEHTDRPCVADPSRVAATPCVLVEPPVLEPDGVLCGKTMHRFTVLVIGLPGARAELAPLADLLEQTLGGLEELGYGWTLAEPVGYVPLMDSASAEPCQAYRITVEEYLA